MRTPFAILILIALAACVTVREEDLNSWVGQPVSKLDRHPVFSLMPVEVQQSPDGTEIRNYVNGANVRSCFGSSTASAFSPYMITVNSGGSCVQRFAACNNRFYIQRGVVQQYVPVGTGGARCFTDARATPDGWRGQNLDGLIVGTR